MATLEDRVEALSRTQWLRGMSWMQLELLAGYMAPERASAGALLVEEGQRAAAASVIVSGSVHVAKRDASGVDRVVARLRAGHCFGEISLLDGQPSSAFVIADTDVVLLTLSAANLEKLSEEKPRLGLELYRRLGRLASQHLRQTTSRLVDSLHDEEF